jgi:hypothetical protein
MFTNICGNKVIDLIENNRMGNYEDKGQLVKVIKECLQQSYFRFNDKFYIQERGLPMGSPLSPILAEIFMNNFENKLILKTKYKKNIKLWVRYVDDILIIWEGDVTEVETFVREINNIDHNIQFKEEIGGKTLNYLDLNIKINNEEKIIVDIFRKETYSDLIIPKDSYHPFKYKTAAIYAFCYRTIKCLKDKDTKEREIQRIKKIVKNNNYNTKIVDNIIDKIEKGRDNEDRQNKNYVGSITYIGTSTRKIIECFNKSGLEVTIKKGRTVFDIIKNNNTENVPILEKSGIYKLRCDECSKIYLGETGRKFKCRLTDHKRGEGVRTTNSLYARHFIETNHKFVNPLENYEIIKVINNNNERKINEELEILKEREKNINNLMNIQIKFENEDIFHYIIKNNINNNKK